MDIQRAKAEVLEAVKELVDLGLVARTWGNVSCRADENRFVITPSGIGYERLTPDNLVVVHMDTLQYEGEIKPSSEKRIHLAAYQSNPSVSFVIHTHQTYATCISVSGFEHVRLSADERQRLGGDIGLGAYGISGTKKLAKIVAGEFSKGRSAVLMEKHGAVLIGGDRRETFARAALLEDICHRAMNGTPDFDDSGSEYDTDGENSVMCLSSEAVNLVMKNRDRLPAIIDDFAQIIGPDMKSVAQENAAAGLNGRNAVYVRGIGALCYAENDSDCRAMLTLVEKNALAYLNAKNNGESPALSFLEKRLMRYIYTKKYAKKK